MILSFEMVILLLSAQGRQSQNPWKQDYLMFDHKNLEDGA